MKVLACADVLADLLQGELLLPVRLLRTSPRRPTPVSVSLPGALRSDLAPSRVYRLLHRQQWARQIKYTLFTRVSCARLVLTRSEVLGLASSAATDVVIELLQVGCDVLLMLKSLLTARCRSDKDMEQLLHVLQDDARLCGPADRITAVPQGRRRPPEVTLLRRQRSFIRCYDTLCISVDSQRRCRPLAEQ